MFGAFSESFQQDCLGGTACRGRSRPVGSSSLLLGGGGGGGGGGLSLRLLLSFAGYWLFYLRPNRT